MLSFQLFAYIFFVHLFFPNYKLCAFQIPGTISSLVMPATGDLGKSTYNRMYSKNNFGNVFFCLNVIFKLCPGHARVEQIMRTNMIPSDRHADDVL